MEGSCESDPSVKMEDKNSKVKLSVAAISDVEEASNSQDQQLQQKRQRVESPISPVSPATEEKSSDPLDTEVLPSLTTQCDPEMIKQLKISIKKKEEQLSKLKLVEYYRNKWSKDELKGIIDEWKQVAIASFEDLYTRSCNDKPDLTKEDLLEYLGVDPELVNSE